MQALLKAHKGRPEDIVYAALRRICEDSAITNRYTYMTCVMHSLYHHEAIDTYISLWKTLILAADDKFAGEDDRYVPHLHGRHNPPKLHRNIVAACLERIREKK